MDPLSIAASIVGLLAAGGKLTAVLTQISRLSDGPPLCRSALSEICDVSAALRQMQRFLNDQASIPAERRENVLLEHLAAALTGCVITKDELETVVDDLGLAYQESGITGIFDRVRWVRKEKDIQHIIQRLQNHKSSLNLILSIFQCSSSNQIQDSVARLCRLVEQAVASSSALSVRLSRLETNSTVGRADTEIFALEGGGIAYDEEEREAEDSASVQTVRPNVRTTSETSVAAQSFTFDPTLQSSRVYRKLELTQSDGHSESSITTSTRQRAALSIFCTATLDEISNLSQFSLPIFIQEISNNRWYVSASIPIAIGYTRRYYGPGEARIEVRMAFCAYNKLVFDRVMGPDDYCGKIKEIISIREGFPTRELNLLFHGRSLKDGEMLKAYGIGTWIGTARVELRLLVGVPSPDELRRRRAVNDYQFYESKEEIELAGLFSYGYPRLIGG
jgi:hypothetical protein